MWDRWGKLTIALVVGCAIGVGLVALYRPGAARMAKLDEQIEQLRASNEELEREKAALERRKSMLEHNPLTVEIEARRRFGLIKEGETVYVVKDWPEDQ